MTLTKDDWVSIALVALLASLIFGIGYGVGSNTSRHNLNLYYDIGVSDGYHDGIETCGEAAILKVESNGTQWFHYTGGNGKIGDKTITWASGQT